MSNVDGVVVDVYILYIPFFLNKGEYSLRNTLQQPWVFRFIMGARILLQISTFFFHVSTAVAMEGFF